jgi:hypothetical protein
MPIGDLNFQRADYGTQTVALDHCAFCSRGITNEFYRTNGDVTCAVCADQLRDAIPKDTRQIFLQSVRAGVLAAIATSLVYLILFRWMTAHGMGMGTAFGAIAVG